MQIHNCHMHIFTVDHVPENFLPLGLAKWMKLRYLQKPLRYLLVNLNPFSNRDLFERYANFIGISTNKTQQQVFEVVRAYYPLDTRFVVLPMDMAYMDAGKVPVAIDAQHDELARLVQTYPQQIIPFAAVDPRRPKILQLLKIWVEEKGFKGIKLYPPLGYMPNDPLLMMVYQYAEARNLPVMTHCSRGGVRNKNFSAAEAARYSDPDNYLEILQRFPKLKICMGHCGGDQDWNQYLDQPWDDSKPRTQMSWLSKILDIMRSGKYPNFFADISYTIFHIEENSQILKVLLQDERIKSQILFGSDFYMVEQERFPERRLTMSLRATLGEDLFRQIAEINPQRYLSSMPLTLPN